MTDAYRGGGRGGHTIGGWGNVTDRSIAPSQRGVGVGVDMVDSGRRSSVGVDGWAGRERWGEDCTNVQSPSASLPGRISQKSARH